MSLTALIHSSRLRLLDLSQRNRALKMPRLLPGRELDLHSLGWTEGTPPEAILASVVAQQRVALLKPAARAYPEAERLGRSLTRLYRLLQHGQRETGAYDLYVGYPFVQGRFAEGSVARCPLLLFPVQLVRRVQGDWTLAPRRLDEALLNEAFFRALEKFNERLLPPEFWAFNPRQGSLQLLLNQLYAHLKQWQIPIDFNSQLFLRQLDPWVDYQEESLGHWPIGQLSLHPQAALGIFPPYDTALLQDYRSLLEAPEAFDLATLIDPPPAPAVARPARAVQAYPLPVDHGQEQALWAIQAGQSIVVHGPPGTGKSQLIVNAVANALVQGQKVLVVSEKRAALEVVSKRLADLGLGPWAYMIHDYRGDRDSLYARLLEQAAASPTASYEHTEADALRWQQRAEQQDRLAAAFSARAAVLYTPLACGYSPAELYVRTQDTRPGRLDWPAEGLDRHQLEDFFLWIERLRPFQDLLDPQHPWRARPSWTQLPEAAREEAAAWVEQLPEWLAQLQAYQAQRLPGLPIEDTEELDAAVQQLEQRMQPLHPASWPAWVWAAYHGPAATLEPLEQAQRLLEAYWRAMGTLPWQAEPHTRLDELPLQLKLAYRPLAWLRPRSRRARTQLNRLFRLKGLPRARLAATLDAALACQQLARSALAALPGPLRQQLETALADPKPLEAYAEALHWFATRYLACTLLPAYRPLPGPTGLPHWAHWQQLLASLQQAVVARQQLRQQLAQAAGLPGLGAELPQTLASKAAAGDGAAWAALLAQHFQPERFRAVDALWAEAPAALQRLWQAAQRAGCVWAETLKSTLETDLPHIWLQQAEAQHPILRDPQAEDYAVRCSQYRQLEDQLAQQLRHQLPQRVAAAHSQRAEPAATTRELLHQLAKKRRRWPLRQLISQFWATGLGHRMPCVLASPETVAAAWPMVPGLFDLIIVDEASQCPTERLLTVLLRGRQVVVAGDPHQLPPTDLFRVQAEVDELVAEYYDPDARLASAIDSESILHLAQQRLPAHPLRGHYRSRYPALIAFSHRAFYQDSLQMLPRPAPAPPILYHRLAGRFDKGVNQVEVEAVADTLEQLLAQPQPPSVGVVTFNYPQQQALLDELDRRTLAHARAGRQAEAQRLATAFDLEREGTLQGLFVKNIEHVQGDERDVILFSIGYAPNAQGRVPASFGWLNQVGGQNRLNVAITRARQQVQLFCSFLPEQLEVAHTLHPGPKLLKAYLRYAWALSSGQPGLAQQVLDELAPPPAPANALGQARTAYLRGQLHAAGLAAQPPPPLAQGLYDLAVHGPGGWPSQAWLIEGPAHPWRSLLHHLPHLLEQAGIATTQLLLSSRID
ncbi:MAG: AAA domain-containing protein [Sphingobacteriia bacterium]